MMFSYVLWFDGCVYGAHLQPLEVQHSQSFNCFKKLKVAIRKLQAPSFSRLVTPTIVLQKWLQQVFRSAAELLSSMILSSSI